MKLTAKRTASPYIDLQTALVKGSSPQIDSLLEPLVQMSGADEIGVYLSQLIAVHAEPVINRVIRYKLRHNLNRSGAEADAEDLRQEAIAQLLVELQKLHSNIETHPIRDMRGLAATIAYRLCAQWMRRQFPRQHALRNRIQYLLTRQAGFALWPDDNDEMKKLIAGFAAWKGQRPSSEAASLRRLPQDERLLESLGGGGSSTDLRDALATIFIHVGGPVEFDELVKTIAVLLQITDPKIESVDAGSDDTGVELADQEADVAWRVEKRIFLQRLWEEVRQLPLQQRVALLLNLRDHKGRGCIALFPATGIASIDQLAEALEMREEQLAELWNDLPLEDSKIAELLQQTRQQIINARQSARRRLARRLKGFF
jgi:DNA-directed RNA polymerase specialized sigma24 family protein